MTPYNFDAYLKFHHFLLINVDFFLQFFKYLKKCLKIVKKHQKRSKNIIADSFTKFDFNLRKRRWKMTIDGNWPQMTSIFVNFSSALFLYYCFFYNFCFVFYFKFLYFLNLLALSWVGTIAFIVCQFKLNFYKSWLARSASGHNMF